MPEKFGKYLLYGRIASGGMASVFLAKQEDEPDQWVAVKRVHPHLVSREDVRQMFLNEANLLARLDFPNICGVIDFGIQDGSPFLVMRYLHGVPLSGLLRRLIDNQKKWPVDLMAYVCACVCDGLHYAHEARGDNGPLGLVHRDISPQNIFITFAGDVKLLDFGVAKVAGFTGLTRTGYIKGKYAYMSPEQVEAEDLDRRSDLFSLGVVLWESLTGRHLFKRKRGSDTVKAVLAAVTPSPSEFNSAVPLPLDKIVLRALEARVKRRYQTAERMGGDLWSYLTTTAIPMGSDEVAEILIQCFPDRPSPGEAAMSATQPDALQFAVETDKVPPETDEDPTGQAEQPEFGSIIPMEEEDEDESNQTIRCENLIDGIGLTVSDPKKGGEIGQIVEELKREVMSQEESDEENDPTKPFPLPEDLTARPRVLADAKGLDEPVQLPPDTRDTLITDEDEVQPVPTEAISGTPSDDEEPAEETAAMDPTWNQEPERDPTEKRSPMVALLVALALLVAAGLTVLFVMDQPAKKPQLEAPENQ